MPLNEQELNTVNQIGTSLQGIATALTDVVGMISNLASSTTAVEETQTALQSAQDNMPKKPEDQTMTEEEKAKKELGTQITDPTLGRSVTDSDMQISDYNNAQSQVNQANAFVKALKSLEKKIDSIDNVEKIKELTAKFEKQKAELEEKQTGTEAVLSTLLENLGVTEQMVKNLKEQSTTLQKKDEVVGINTPEGFAKAFHLFKQMEKAEENESKVLLPHNDFKKSEKNPKRKFFKRSIFDEGV